jgi:hypothetical protein
MFIGRPAKPVPLSSPQSRLLPLRGVAQTGYDTRGRSAVVAELP